MGRRATSSRSGSCSTQGNRRSSTPRDAHGRRPRQKGIINTWNVEKQFGFVSCDGGHPDLFTHAEYIKNVQQRYEAKNRGLRRGDRIAFDIQEPMGGKKSAEAVHVELLDSVKRSKSVDRSRSCGSRSRRREAMPRPKEVVDIRAGDWECPKCNDHQFARNTECRRCGAPKPRDAPRVMVQKLVARGGRRWCSPSPPQGGRRSRSPLQRRSRSPSQRSPRRSRSRNPRRSPTWSSVRNQQKTRSLQSRSRSLKRSPRQSPKRSLSHSPKRSPRQIPKQSLRQSPRRNPMTNTKQSSKRNLRPSPRRSLPKRSLRPSPKRSLSKQSSSRNSHNQSPKRSQKSSQKQSPNQSPKRNQKPSVRQSPQESPREGQMQNQRLSRSPSRQNQNPSRNQCRSRSRRWSCSRDR